MADTFNEDEIRQAIEAGDVGKLRAHWYAKVKDVHENIFNALGQLEPIIVQADIAPQKHAFESLRTAAREVASLDSFVAAASVSYTKFSDQVRQAFRIKFKSLETIKIISSATVKNKLGTASDFELHARIIALVDRIFDFACQTSNIDCFRLLLNGYVDSLGQCKDDNA